MGSPGDGEPFKNGEQRELFQSFFQLRGELLSPLL